MIPRTRKAGRICLAAAALAAATTTTTTTRGGMMAARGFSIGRAGIGSGTIGGTTAGTAPSSSAASSSGGGASSSVAVRDALYRVRDCNRVPPEIRGSLLDFEVDGMRLGKVRPSVAEMLCSASAAVIGGASSSSPAFRMAEDGSGEGRRFLTLSDEVGGGASAAEARTEAVRHVMERLRDDGVVTGWRDEPYPVTTSFYDPPAFSMERAAVPLLGAVEYGVHVNGIVLGGDDENGNGDGDNGVRMWIGRRSKAKSKFPGMLDHVVAGGQPCGMSLIDNVVKECMEEAGIPEELVRRGVRSAGAVSYETYLPRKDTIQRSVLFCYDLVLPPDFVPKPVDGEVDEFFLWSVDQVIESMSPEYPDPIKPNCYLVIVDFLLRHSYLDPDVPGYLDVLRELRSGDCR